MKYLPWGLVALLALVLTWSFWAGAPAESIGTVNLNRIVDESARAQELNQKLNDRYNELITQFNLEEEAEEDDPGRADRERQAYAEYLAYRQELEVSFQEETDRIISEVAKNSKVAVVVDEDVVRFGGEDLTNEVIRKLK